MWIHLYRGLDICICSKVIAKKISEIKSNPKVWHYKVQWKKVLEIKSHCKQSPTIGISSLLIKGFFPSFSKDFIFRNFFLQPSYYYRKKRNLILRTSVLMTFCPWTSENWDKFTKV